MMWRAFAEQFKECGRSGTLFIFAVLAVFPLLILGSEVATGLGDWAIPVFTGLWLVFVGVALGNFIYTWRHPARLGRLPPLSQNDLAVARSKLMKHRATR